MKCFVDVAGCEKVQKMKRDKERRRKSHKGLEFCKWALVGRLDLTKLATKEVKDRCAEQWKPKGEWQATPLGRGYIMFRFTDEQDYNRVQGTGYICASRPNFEA
ncbi:hypothetical protein IFM89_027463 [Coptis chinensis]|uniref:DUF4283 domain-containing protein n=1 Tax=Coptis chinensis TaxID=261450 RepID=A0A835MDP1_9MAGN|nr:hypothetical protein IFM89_027463 [Coptis chinensis]